MFLETIERNLDRSHHNLWFAYTTAQRNGQMVLARTIYQAIENVQRASETVQQNWHKHDQVST